MKQLWAALFFLIFVPGGAPTALAQHEGHVMAPAPAQQMPMPRPKPKASPNDPERPKPPANPAKRDEALQPVKVHFDRLKQWASKVQMDFERLRTIDNLDELRDAMRRHSLMLDQLQMMLIEHEALLNDQMRPPPGPAKRGAVETDHSPSGPHGTHAAHSEEKKP